MAVKTIEIDVKVDSSKAVKGVDNLSKSTKKLDKGTDSLKKSNAGLSDSLGGLGGGFAGAATGAKALGKQMLVLLANPIGLIIAGIAVAVLAVKTAFTSSEEGQNKYNKLMGVLGALLGNLIDLLADFGEAIIDVFENPMESLRNFADAIKENIINRFEGILEFIPKMGEAIGALFEGDFVRASQVAFDAVSKVSTGVENMTEKLNNAAKATGKFFEEQKREAALAASVADMRAKADKVERDLLVRRSVLQSKIAQLRLKSRQEDQFTAAERRQALLDAQVLEDELLDRETKVLELRRDAQVLENTFSRSNKENLDKEAKAIAAVNNQVAARANVARALQRELNTIQGEIDAKTKAEETKQAALTAKQKEIEDKRLELIRSSGEKAVQIELELKQLRADAGIEDPNATVEQIQQAFEIKQAVEDEQFQIELEKNQSRFDEGLIIEEERKAQEALLEEKHTLTIEGLKKDSIDRISKEESAAAALKSKNEIEAAEGTVKVSQDVLAAVSSVLAEGSAEAKAIALANATISGIQGVQAAYTSASAVPIVGVALGPIAAAAAAVVAGKNISKIANQKTGAKGGGGASVGSSSLNTPASAPSLNEETLFSSQNLQGAGSENIGEGAGVNQIKAVVVESDITDAQSRINNIERSSEIG